jgi:hypothetical protein
MVPVITAHRGPAPPRAPPCPAHKQKTRGLASEGLLLAQSCDFGLFDRTRRPASA